MRKTCRWIALACGFSVTLVLCVEPAEGQVTFVNRIAEKGIVNDGFGRGAGMADLDGDGRLDLMAANTGPNVIYRQLPDGTFEESSAAWGIEPGNEPTWGMLATDFDNDGDVDLYQFTGGFIDVEAFGMGLLEGAGAGIEGIPNRMLRNDLDTSGVFVDVSAQAGDASALVTATFGATAVDYDRDGDLDIFHCDEPIDQPCRLLRNDGDLFFTDVSVSAGIDDLGEFRHVGSGDFDNDGWVDLAVGGPVRNFVYRNNGDGTFAEVAAAIGLDSDGGNFGVVFTDFNNDGWMDAYLPKYDRNQPEPRPRLFLNRRDGTFFDVSDSSGIGGQTDMGHTVADFDADGFPDVLAGTGGPFDLEPDRLYLIRPDGDTGLRAIDVSMLSGILSEGNSRQHGQAVGDFDDDGDLDIFANNGGPRLLDTAQEGFLWENEGNANAWIGLDLVGNFSNRPGIGARAGVVTDSGRTVFRYRDGGRGFGNTNAPTLHFGLGDDTVVDMAQVSWPSGIRQIRLSPEVGARHTVAETGILGEATAPIGDSYAVEICGTAGDEVEVIVADGARDRLMPQRGGIARLQPPIEIITVVTLGADGRATAQIPIEDDPDLVGNTLYIQTWFHEPGATEGGSLSNLLTVSIVE